MNFELAIRYLLKSATNEEKEFFQSWLAQSDKNLKEFKIFSEAWARSGNKVKSIQPDENTAWETFSSLRNNYISRKLQVARKQYFSAGRVAATVAILITGIFTVFLLHKPKNEKFIFYQAVDSVIQIKLADQSTICLNAGSELRIPEKTGNNKYECFLRGEAYFEIHRNEERTFQVSTDHTTTSVHGTAFTILSDDKKDVINLINGSISLSVRNQKGKSVMLCPGQKAIFDLSSGTISTQQSPDDNFMAWKTGILVFRNTPLSVVMQDIASYYNLQTERKNLQQFGFTLTATFNCKKLTIEEIISILELTWNVDVSIENNTLLVK